MTVGMYGSPDWLRPTPAGSRAIYAGTYNSGVSSTIDLGWWFIAGYQAIVIIIKPDQDQSVEIRYGNGSPNPVQVFQRFMVCRAGFTGNMNAPAAAQAMQLHIGRLDTNPGATGTIYVIGHNAGFDPALARGVYQLAAVDSESVGSFVTNQHYLNGPVEGLATFTLTSSQTEVYLNVNILVVPATFGFIGQIRVMATDTPVSANLWVPANSLRVDIGNASAATATVQWSCVVGS